MSESLGFEADDFELPAGYQARLDALPKENFTEDPAAIFDQAVSEIFDTAEFSMCLGEFTGGSPNAVAAVHYGLYNSLEQAAHREKPEDGPVHVIYPVEEYFEQPDPVIVAAMRRRSDHLEELFMVEELGRVLGKAPEENGGCIESAFTVDHPDFSWVEVQADSEFGILFKFYKEEPTDPQAPEDISFYVRLNCLSLSEASLLTSKDYPYYYGMSLVIEQKEEGESKKEISLEIPADIEPVLSYAAKQLIIEKAAEQHGDHIEESETKRIQAGKIIAEGTDPAAIERILADHGIADDPETFLL